PRVGLAQDRRKAPLLRQLLLGTRFGFRSSPRKRGPRTTACGPWIPAYAGMSGIMRLHRTHLLVPAARFLRPGLLTFASLTRIEGWAERRETFGCQRAPVGRAVSRHARRLARRLASHNAGRSPLGAPPRRFWASGPRFRLLRRPPPYNGGQLPSDPCSGPPAARA